MLMSSASIEVIELMTQVVLSDVTEQALQYVPTQQSSAGSRSLKYGSDLELIRRNGLNIISKSLSRVAKKASPNDIEGFTKKIMANITTTTDALVSSPEFSSSCRLTDQLHERMI
jgi:hypothetical protein